MALPKRKVSKSRRDMRRSHDHLKPIALSSCPRCNQPKLPHKVCGNCGFYKGKDILKLEKE